MAMARSTFFIVIPLSQYGMHQSGEVNQRIVGWALQRRY